MRTWRNIYPVNGHQKKARVAILTSGKLDFKAKTVTRDKERALYHNKGDNPTRRSKNCKYLCTQHGKLKYIKQLITNMKELINSNKITVGTLTLHLHQWIDHPNRKSTRKKGL